MTEKIGFIGQGWIGKHYADDFESREFEVVRYSLEEPFVENKPLIPGCDIVFIAVPTPTTTNGFDISYVKDALSNVGKGKIAVIKSTLYPGTTEKLQNEFPHVFIFHSPEFLVEKTAAHDASNPNRNIVGFPVDNVVYRQKAVSVLRVLPDAPYQRIMSSRDAEFVKYAGNCFLFSKVIFMNILYELVKATDSDWSTVREAMIHDPRIGESHTEPVHSSGRGAGGHCLIKDFEAFRHLYNKAVSDAHGGEVLKTMAEMNIDLLKKTNKDIDLLMGVYGVDLKVQDKQ